MTDDDREAISCGIAELAEGKVIARRRIGRRPSVISRDIARHGGRTAYRATVAARAAARSRRRPKARKLDADRALQRLGAPVTVAVCDVGHAYTAGNGCPRCRQEAKNAWQRERAERRATRDVLHHQPPARGVPEQVEDDAWREEAACRYDDDQAL
ncbi:MAG: helix-turn-helix domain-containing protein [Actinomycetota bacterium]|nr:helix-turn-helix domain-containing protein [Actinomycetota bacterium]